MQIPKSKLKIVVILHVKLTFNKFTGIKNATGFFQITHETVDINRGLRANQKNALTKKIFLANVIPK